MPKGNWVHKTSLFTIFLYCIQSIDDNFTNESWLLLVVKTLSQQSKQKGLVVVTSINSFTNVFHHQTISLKLLPFHIKYVLHSAHAPVRDWLFKKTCCRISCNRSTREKFAAVVVDRENSCYCKKWILMIGSWQIWQQEDDVLLPKLNGVDLDLNDG